ncbi:hypothetical protein CEXT_504971 [Caerostris extrusa]|uniref:Uncharacterized protein n=1 Tax=Caerostris extrusa TaxID=172846 RepID=A0AAV4PH92_CAEEX|nr:hypothetical protein CEXT_504971 [Caerostris extrusa]
MGWALSETPNLIEGFERAYLTHMPRARPICHAAAESLACMKSSAPMGDVSKSDDEKEVECNEVSEPHVFNWMSLDWKKCGKSMMLELRRATVKV